MLKDDFTKTVSLNYIWCGTLFIFFFRVSVVHQRLTSRHVFLQILNTWCQASADYVTVFRFFCSRVENVLNYKLKVTYSREIPDHSLTQYSKKMEWIHVDRVTNARLSFDIATDLHHGTLHFLVILEKLSLHSIYNRDRKEVNILRGAWS